VSANDNDESIRVKSRAAVLAALALPGVAVIGDEDWNYKGWWR